MPVAAPVTRAVFPLMNMSHFLKHGGKLKRKTPRRENSECRTGEFIPIDTLHTSAPCFSYTDFNKTLSYYTYDVFCARVNR